MPSFTRSVDAGIPLMAKCSYGYGRWDAAYWFIGPEQGQSPDEPGLKKRLEVWEQFGRRELDDCRAFHDAICETRWHREKPRLQFTWRPLMILLMTYLARPTDKESMRNYQRERWGALDGETCVIELSGLAAHNSGVSRDRRCFRQERIQFIRTQMLQYRPTLVVMYGKTQTEAWQAIAACDFRGGNV